MKSILLSLVLFLNFSTFSSSFDILVNSKPLNIFENGCEGFEFASEEKACYLGDARGLVNFMNDKKCQWGDGAFEEAKILADESIRYVHYHLGGVEPVAILKLCQD